MKLRLLTLNIELGRFLDRVIRYIQEQKIDVIHLQEVSGGLLQKQGLDCFEELLLRLQYKGELAIFLRKKNRPDTYIGNATFYKPELTLVDTHTVWLREYFEVEHIDTVWWGDVARNALAVTFTAGDKKFICINTHLSWSPTPEDTPDKLAQGSKLVAYIQKIQEHFVLSGDFNVNSGSKIIRDLSQCSRNLTVEAGITNTLDLRLHKARKKIPNGLAVDFAFVSKNIKKAKVTVLKDERLSDHLGQIVEFEI